MGNDSGFKKIYTEVDVLKLLPLCRRGIEKRAVDTDNTEEIKKGEERRETRDGQFYCLFMRMRAEWGAVMGGEGGGGGGGGSGQGRTRGRRHEGRKKPFGR